MINHNLFSVLARMKFSNSKTAGSDWLLREQKCDISTLKHAIFIYLFSFYERKFENLLLPEHNRVHQVFVPGESSHEILYHWRELGHTIAGLRLPKTFQVIVYNRECMLIFKVFNLIMIICFVPEHGIQS